MRSVGTHSLRRRFTRNHDVRLMTPPSQYIRPSSFFTFAHHSHPVHSSTLLKLTTHTTMHLHLLVILPSLLSFAYAQDCWQGAHAICCPECAQSGPTGPCTDAIPVGSLTECTLEKYPVGWACCIDDVGDGSSNERIR
ncbi:hypothetical protein M011DRAFT_75408 [Sporormia fimetaria CBS 119925]|uniref:Uncharacterized protein n=1 Tax=Sporormia fimetaria CBS 119925 TaxID=1340428 RepID=A0A6A6V809_9PLEO|nr:hypothetical protein M011DRAFT_75408 [Sporormia fimetaria CBS 119925]